VPIRVRLTVAFACATLVLFAVAGFLFVRSFRHGLETSLDPGLRAQADTLVRQLRTDAAGVDLRASDGGLPTRDVVAQVLDRGGGVVTSTREAGTEPVIGRTIVDRARNATEFAQVRLGGEREPYRVLARAAPATNGLVVVVATSLEPTFDAVDRVRTALFIGGSLAVVLAGVGAWFLATAALKPVERMRQRAAEISEHDPGSRLPVPATRDEIAALGTTMNDLLARLQHALAVQRAFVADAGHELRTPLAVLGTELELAGRPDRTYDDLRDSIRHAASETERLQHLAEDLLFLARRDDQAGGDEHDRFEPAAVGPLIEQSFAAMRARAVDRGVRLHLSGDDAIRARLDGPVFRRGLDNLVDNALRYAPRDSTIEVRVSTDARCVVIDVLDDGPGFPRAFLSHAFERFRRADDARSRFDGGSGLGLAIVAASAQAHGGTACAANRNEGGAIVTIRLPALEV
jgi:signal transduction histidine kinase